MFLGVDDTIYQLIRETNFSLSDACDSIKLGVKEMSLFPCFYLGLVHTYPDIFQNAYFIILFRNKLRPHGYGEITNKTYLLVKLTVHN